MKCYGCNNEIGPEVQQPFWGLQLCEACQAEERITRAAPDLLSACELLVSWVDGRIGNDSPGLGQEWFDSQAPFFQQAYWAAVHAISKARGNRGRA